SLAAWPALRQRAAASSLREWLSNRTDRILSWRGGFIRTMITRVGTKRSTHAAAASADSARTRRLRRARTARARTCRSLQRMRRRSFSRKWSGNRAGTPGQPEETFAQDRDCQRGGRSEAEPATGGDHLVGTRTASAR